MLHRPWAHVPKIFHHLVKAPLPHQGNQEALEQREKIRRPHTEKRARESFLYGLDDVGSDLAEPHARHACHKSHKEELAEEKVVRIEQKAEKDARHKSCKDGSK